MCRVRRSEKWAPRDPLSLLLGGQLRAVPPRDQYGPIWGGPQALGPSESCFPLASHVSRETSYHVGMPTAPPLLGFPHQRGMGDQEEEDRAWARELDRIVTILETIERIMARRVLTAIETQRRKGDDPPPNA